MKLMLFALSILLLANIFLWWPHNVIVSLFWCAALIASPNLIGD